jgi:flagellar motor switch protein FliM
MEKILNQDEIDALFRAARGSAKAATPARHVTPLNFRAATQANEDDIRSVTGLQETFARHLSHSLSAYLRVVFDVALVAAEQLTYSEFLPRVPELTYLCTVNIAGIDAPLVVQLELGVVFPMIDLLLGGRGRPEPQVRELTEIEEYILETLVDLIVAELRVIWQSFGIDFTFGMRQPQTEVIRLMAPRDRVLAFGFEVRLPEIRGALNVVYPAVISNLLRKQRGLNAPQKQRDRSRSSARLRELLLDCTFPADLQMARMKISTEKLLHMLPGDVLTFRREIDTPVSLQFGGVPLYAAQLVRKNACRAAYLQRRTAGDENSSNERIETQP